MEPKERKGDWFVDAYVFNKACNQYFSVVSDNQSDGNYRISPAEIN
jgi:hypothetical protein